MAQVFRPVRSTEERLFNKNNPISPEEGYLYFTTDTKKIYLGSNGEYLPMGGNSGVYYGNRIPAEGEEDSENITFQFSFTAEIEGSNAPNVDDLILNIPDGCFYRVVAVNIDADTVTANKLTIAGSGGGGGGGGTTVSRPVINGLLDNNTYFSAIETDKMKITFNCSSQQPEGNSIDRVEYSIGSHTFSINKSYAFGETITIDLSQHLDILSTQTVNTMNVQVADVFGNTSYIKPFSFYVLSLTLKTGLSSILSVKKGEAYNYSFIPVGGNVSGGSSSLSRYAEITISPLDSPTVITYSDIRNINTTGTEQIVSLPFNDESYGFKHGVYLLKVTYCIQIKSTGDIVKSNVLQHQIAYIDTTSSIPLIATSFIDNETVTQYSTYSMEYMVALGNENNDIQVKFEVENDSITVDAVLNVASIWTYTFTKTGTFPIILEYVNEGMRQQLGSLNVIEYSSDDIPSIDTSLVEFQLSPLGKSNNQSNKDEWISNYKGKEHKALFENFLWGDENGWITDIDGPCLKLTNGAKLSIPTYRPFEKNATDGGFTIELDFKFSNVSDYKKALIQCLSPTYGEDGNIESYRVGFQITGEKATLNSANIKATTTAIKGEEKEDGTVDDKEAALQSFIQYFGEDSKIHLTYVIENLNDKTSDYHFVYTYLNGVLSGIMEMAADNFKDTDIVPATIEIDSTYGDIYFYGIRTYRSAITPRMAINDYIADISNVDNKIALAKNNAVFNDSNKVSKEVIDTLSSTLGVKYCIFEGGYKMPKKFNTPYTFSEEDTSRALPTTKTDFRLMSFKMCEKTADKTTPTVLMDVPMELTDDKGNKVNTDADISVGTAYSFNRGVQLYGQGTSSMVYPVKNLRLKFINEKDYPTVYEGSMPVQIVCFKADYMDSSSTHNTCTGNLVYDLYKSLNLKTPPQEFGSEYDIVTAIKGFPIICFYKNYSSSATSDDAYTYIGRYNFNLDKATPEPFGFPGQYRYTGKQTSDGRKEVETCGIRVEEVEGMKVLPLDEDGNEVVEDIVQCWEFRNNDTGSPTKFLTPAKSGGGKYLSYADALTNTWADYYEDRYPDEISGLKEDGKLETTPWAQQALEEGLFRMSKWVNSTATDINEVSNQPLDKEVYYLTLDDDIPTEGITYYNAAHEAQDVHSIEAIDIESNFTGSNEKDKVAEADIQIINDTFMNNSYVNNTHNTYTFSYDGTQWGLVYYDGNNTVTIDNIVLSDFGISIINGASASSGQSIIVELYGAYSNWTPTTLYEKHTIDNERYRLAKFKNEFTDYFNMDFCLFYYILTLALLMMDSRAKNMMMASWDLKIWYPIFYDMDTSLGLNNTGFNKFSYDTEDDPNDKVFNGFDSVLWNNFREVFTDEITSFYNKMRNYMTLNKLLTTYNTNGADAFNEALTSMDAIYKYERPYEEGYDDTSGSEPEHINPGQINYLYAAQGRRSNHRTWWITNRLNYLDSKYRPLSYGNSKPSQSEAFSFRAYALPKQKGDSATKACVADVPANHQFNLTALTNSYQSLFIGNIVYGPVYATAGQTVTVGSTSPKHEVESYILNPNLIADLGDLSDKYIGSWQMPKNKLTELKFGRSSRSHPGKYKTYFNQLLTQLSFGSVKDGSNTPYLKYLNIARCTGLTNLDLSPCSKLQVLDAEGCKLTNIIFPENSILSELYLPQSLKQLNISNQPYLNTVVFDNFDLGEIPSLDTFKLLNVPNFDSYKLAKAVFDKRKTTSNVLEYALTNINWTITYDGSISNPTEVTTIDILDDLLNEDYKSLTVADGYSKATALTGTITLAGHIKADEYKLYAKYKKAFPNLTIKFNAEIDSNITKAKNVIFMADEKTATDNRVHYQVCADGSLTLTQLTSASTSPLGYGMTAPKKVPTNEFVYAFTGRWESDAGEYYIEDEKYRVEMSDRLFAEAKPDAMNLVLYPIYNVQKQKYLVTFYDWNKKAITQIDSNGEAKTAWEVEYGSYYDGPLKNFYYRPDTDLNDDERYKFEGWGDRQGENPIYIDLATTPITSNRYLYAHYKVEDVSNPSPEEYFNIQILSHSMSNDFSDDVQTTENWATISVKSEYNDVLQGKITIPKSVNGIDVKCVGNFSEAKLITHVYFEPGNQIIAIAKNAFSAGPSGRDTLKRVDLPISIRYIGVNAFYHQAGLVEVPLNNQITHIGDSAFDANSKLLLTALPTELKYLGSRAFAAMGQGFKITKIPDNITILPSYVFATSRNVRISDFGGDNSKLERIERGACQYTDPKQTSDTGYTEPFPITVTFGSKITYLSENCFADSYVYGPQVKNIIFANELEDYNSGAFSKLEDLLNYIGITKVTDLRVTIGKEGDMVI